MSGKRQKKLSLKRAYFNEGFNSNLEEILKNAFKALPTPRERVVSIDLLSSRAFMSLEQVEEGVALRVFDYEVGATGAVNLDTTDAASAIEAFQHPENKDFLKEQTVILVAGNYLYCCGAGNKAGTLAAHMLDMAYKSEVVSDEVRMNVADVPNKMEIERINKIGVKSVEFGLSNYFETLDLADQQDTGLRVWRMIMGKKHTVDEAMRRSAMIGKVILSRGRFRSDEVEKDQWLTLVGEEVLKAGSAENYKIVLEDDSTLKPTQLQRTKTVQISRMANTYSYSQAVEALQQFQSDCQRDGALGV